MCTHVRVYVFACMHACVCMCVPELNKLCNLQGRQVEYVRQDDSNRRWFNEFRSKSTSTPIGLETVDGWYHIHWLCCVNCASGVGWGWRGLWDVEGVSQWEVMDVGGGWEGGGVF